MQTICPRPASRRRPKTCMTALQVAHVNRRVPLADASKRHEFTLSSLRSMRFSHLRSKGEAGIQLCRKRTFLLAMRTVARRRHCFASRP